MVFLDTPHEPGVRCGGSFTFNHQEGNMPRASNTARPLRTTAGQRPPSSVALNHELVATIRRTMRANKITQRVLAQRLGWNIRLIRTLLSGIVDSLYPYIQVFRALGLELRLTTVPLG